MCRINKGFTLIELMLVVAVIVLLVAVVIPMYRDYTERAKQASFCATVYNIETLLYRWRAEHLTDSYPTLDEVNTLLTSATYLLQNRLTHIPINHLLLQLRLQTKKAV